MLKKHRIILSLLVPLCTTFAALQLHHAATGVSRLNSAAFSAKDELLPVILSAKDRATYHDIFAAQKKGDWEAANTSIETLGNRMLMGHVLAQRYLHRHYESNYAELAEWLNHYSDHPEAGDVYALAVAKAPQDKSDLPVKRKFSSLQGYGDDNGLAGASNPSYMRSWRKGLHEWAEGNFKQAATHFSGLLKDDDLSPWAKSAAAYWAYRSYHAADESDEAEDYLKLAAEDARSFYGILARKQLGMALKLDATPVALEESDVLEIVGEPAIKRIIALAESHESELAEQEMRALFPQSSDSEKLQLLALAHHLNMASVQISMAKHLSHDGRTLDFARYPVPAWQPKGGFTIDPALIYALARQESGFNASAVSPDGASGIMQLMPQTALSMKKNMGSAISENVSAQVLNITLGQNYVEHLLDNNLVDNNLIYMLAAYNAGAGRLQDWKKRFDQDDPLLFLENIPFGETRHYVMQVMANYWIYSELAGNENRSIYALLHGKWPSYDRANAPVASRTGMDKEG